MLNMCDRYTAERFVFFQVSREAIEIASSLRSFQHRVGHRLKDGFVYRWFTDDEIGFDGPEVNEVTKSLIISHDRTVANEHGNPVAESHWRTIEGMMLRTLGYAEEAPVCLWPWAARQMDILMYYLVTRSHEPPTSPFKFSNPHAGPANLSWANPLFCDVTVRLSTPDRHHKMCYRSVTGCYLGRDVNRQGDICYIPSLQRISTYYVVEWRRGEFTACKGITADTPVEYYEVNEFRYGDHTAERVPKRHRKPRKERTAAMAEASDNVEREGVAPPMQPEKEGAAAPIDEVLAKNAKHIDAGIKKLEKEGETAFVSRVVSSLQTASPLPPPLDNSSTELLMAACEPWEVFNRGANCASPYRTNAIEVSFETGRRASVSIMGEPDITTLAAARQSKYWPLIKEEMEGEIRGKLANKAFEAVPILDTEGKRRRIMKTKWVVNIWLNEDKTVRKLKARFVACGYSQVAGKDFYENGIYASALSAPSYRFWVCTVNDEGMCTDKIDAVKAFTQAEVDCPLFAEMPEGFSRPDYCLRLLKAVEGIRQGAHLFYELQKHAWNKVGCFSDVCDPNFYRHKELDIIVAVFVDDVAAGFKPEVRTEYLAMRAEYSKIINVDCRGPEKIVPLEAFIGTEIEWHADRTVTITQQAYARKLAAKYGSKIQPQSSPIPTSKAARERFEAMEPASEETRFDVSLYLSAMGDIGWPTIMTFPQLAYYHSFLGQFMMSPPQEAYDFLLHIIGYIVGNASVGITFGGALRVPMGLDVMPPNFAQSYGTYAYTDSSWNKKPRPYGGHVVFRCNGPWMWSGKCLKVVADSSMEAETAQGSRATKDLIWARQMSTHVQRFMMGPAYLLCDNKAMTEAVNKDGASQRTRYFERATVLIKYAIMRNLVATTLISTEHMVADIFTKPLDDTKFNKFCHALVNARWNNRGFKAKVARLVDALEKTLGNR